MFLYRELAKFLMTKGDKRRDAGLATPDDIQRFDNIAYGNNRKWNVLDVYRVKGDEQINPVIINVHGGGYYYGKKETYQYYCMSLAQQGFAVVNYSYDLAPKRKYPTPILALNTVVDWVFENASKYKFDTTNIFLVGDSAGAQIAAQYTCLCTNEDYRNKLSLYPRQGFIPKGIALNCGLYDMDKAIEDNPKMIRGILNTYLGKKHVENTYLHLNIPIHVTSKFPPAFITTAEYDFLKPQAAILCNVLLEKKIHYEFKCYTSENIRLEHVFHCNIRLKEAQECNEAQCKFFKSLCQ